MELNLNKLNPRDQKMRDEARILRVNVKVPKGEFTVNYAGLSASLRGKLHANYQGARKKEKGEAPAPTFSRLKDKATYSTGDGEGRIVYRAGSDVAFGLLSRGIGA